MSKEEIEILILLLDREIDMYKGVCGRVKNNAAFKERIVELETIKKKLNQNKDK